MEADLSSGTAPPTGGGPADPSGERRPDLEMLLSRLLRSGVLLSSSLIAVGAIWMAVTRRSGYGGFSYHLSSLVRYHPRLPTHFPVTIRETFGGAIRGEPFALIMLGILVLIATPILRVAVSALAFAIRRDVAYTVISLYVLLVLLMGLVLGRSLG